MIIYTVVEVDYPNGLSSANEIHTWTFTSRDNAIQFAKEKLNEYYAATNSNRYRYNSVNVFHSILNDF